MILAALANATLGLTLLAASVDPSLTPVPAATPAPAPAYTHVVASRPPISRFGIRGGAHLFRVPPTSHRFEDRDSAIAPGFGVGGSLAIPTAGRAAVVLDASYRRGAYRVPEEDTEVRFAATSVTGGLRVEEPLSPMTRGRIEAGAGVFAGVLHVDGEGWDDDRYTDSVFFESYGAGALVFRGPRSWDLVVEARASTAPGLIDYGGLSTTVGITNRW